MSDEVISTKKRLFRLSLMWVILYPLAQMVFGLYLSRTMPNGEPAMTMPALLAFQIFYITLPLFFGLMWYYYGRGLYPRAKKLSLVPIILLGIVIITAVVL